MHWYFECSFYVCVESSCLLEIKKCKLSNYAVLLGCDSHCQYCPITGCVLWVRCRTAGTRATPLLAIIFPCSIPRCMNPRHNNKEMISMGRVWVRYNEEKGWQWIHEWETEGDNPAIAPPLYIYSFVYCSFILFN